jgi:hypothetical protein
MNEIERLQAELAAVERELADANAAVAAIEAGEKPAKIRRAPKPKAKAKPKSKRTPVHRNSFKGSVEGYGGPAPVGRSRFRTDNTPVVTKELDPRNRPVDNTYERHECLLLAAAEAGSNLNGITCRCVDCNN